MQEVTVRIGVKNVLRRNLKTGNVSFSNKEMVQLENNEFYKIIIREKNGDPIESYEGPELKKLIASKQRRRTTRGELTNYWVCKRK